MYQQPDLPMKRSQPKNSLNISLEWPLYAIIKTKNYNFLSF